MARNTIAAYRTDLMQFFEWFEKSGPGSLFKVDLKLLARYLEHLHERRLASSSVARHLVSLKMFFRYLVLDGVLAESAVELLSSPKLWQHLPKVLSPETVDRMLAAPTPDDRYPLRDRALMCFLYATGCRASEAAGMRMNDVHLDEGFCRLLGKGNKERIVSLNPVAPAAIEAYTSRTNGRGSRSARLRSALRLPPGHAPVADHDLEPREKIRRPCRLERRRQSRTPCGTRSPRTCWPAEPKSAPCKRCWATPACRRRKSTRTSSTAASRRFTSGAIRGGRRKDEG